MEPTRASILLLDKNEHHTRTTQEGLALAGFSVTAVNDPSECRKILGTRAFDALLIDLLMTRTPDGDLIEWVRAKKPRIRIVVLSDFDSPFLRKQVIGKGAELFVKRPVDLERLTEALASALSPSSPHPVPPREPGRMAINTAHHSAEEHAS